MSTRRRRKILPGGGNRLVRGPSGTADCVDSTPTPGGTLPRRFISSSVAARSKFNSSSFKCLTASCRFFGKTCRAKQVRLPCLWHVVLVADVNRLGPCRSKRGRAKVAHRVRVP